MSKLNVILCTLVFTIMPLCAHDESVPSDKELEHQIHEKISSGWFSTGYDDVTVEVDEGVVYLQGAVQTPEDKEELEKKVRKIKGVKRVLSKLDIRQASSNDNAFTQDKYRTYEDNELNKAIRDKVSRGWLWDEYKEVLLNTSDGVVTLEGVVDSIDDEKKLSKEVQKVKGVKSVKSSLQIRNQ